MCRNPQCIFAAPVLAHGNQFCLTIVTIKRKISRIRVVCSIYIVPQQIIYCRGLILACDKGRTIVHQRGLVELLCQVEHTKATNRPLITVVEVVHISIRIAKVHLILGKAVHSFEIDNIICFAKGALIASHFVTQRLEQIGPIAGALIPCAIRRNTVNRCLHAALCICHNIHCIVGIFFGNGNRQIHKARIDNTAPVCFGVGPPCREICGSIVSGMGRF